MKRSIIFPLLLSAAALFATEPVVISLWEKGAPGFENRRNEPEQAQDYWVRSVFPHRPVNVPTAIVMGRYGPMVEFTAVSFLAGSWF